MGDGSATPKSKLDSLSREDLMKFVKKQVTNLKLVKDQCGEQQSKIARLEEELAIFHQSDAKSVVNKEIYDAVVQTDFDCFSLEVDRGECAKLREQVLVLRTALNRRRFEVDDMRAQLENVVNSPQTSQMEVPPPPVVVSHVAYADVFVQTDENLPFLYESVCAENAQLKNALVIKENKIKESVDALEKVRVENEQLRQKLKEASEKNTKDDEDSLLSLEIQDYERSVQRLQADVSSKQEELTSISNENVSLKKELECVRSSFSSSEKRAHETRSSLVALETELEKCKNELKEKEAVVVSAQEKVEKFERDLNYTKLELADFSSDHHHKLNSAEETVATLRRQLQTTETECAQLKREIKEVTKEYETYKVRAHSAFRQKRVGETETELSSRDEKLFYEKTVSSLQEQLQKSNSVYQATCNELTRLHEQHESLITKHKERELRFEQTVDGLRKQISDLRTDLTIQCQTHDEYIQRSTAAQNQLRVEFEKQIASMAEQHSEKVNELRLQLYRLEDALREARASRATGGSALLSDGEERPPPIDERKPAEGSENVDFKIVQPLTFDFAGRVKSPLSIDINPLDEILNADERSSNKEGLVDYDEYSALETKVGEYTRRIGHLVEVLAESEANNTRLNEQIRLLKEEIRRLERNQEREKHVANAEYLKNVIMKFVNPNSKKDQRAALVPVLAKLLSLSAEEVKLLDELSGDGDRVNQASGWSSYLHRWSGLT